MILRELEEVALAEDAPATAVRLRATLLQQLDGLVRPRTRCRFAAVYPAAMRTVAINDGTHVSTAPDPSLHRAVTELLQSPHLWLVFDTVRREARLLDVAEAQQLLCAQPALPLPPDIR